jgi:hypothetical protein
VNNKISSVISCALIVSMAGLSMPLPADAAMVSSEAAIAASTARAKIASILRRDDLAAQLRARGVNPLDVEARLAVLTDDEAAQLAARIDRLPAGGEIIEALVLVFLILLLTDILGFTKVFPFTRPIDKGRAK